jgi:hypothetical protein
MILEERTYRTVPGGVDRYLSLWQAHGREPQERILGASRGVWAVETGELNTIVFHWAFAGMDERLRRRAILRSDPAFAAFRAQVRDLLVAQHNRILVEPSPPA